jgi:hypothetical protein
MPLTTTVKAGTLPGHPTTAEPMHAARQFALALRHGGLLERAWRLQCELRGETGAGLHGAVLLGLEGMDAQCVDATATKRQLRRIHDKREVRLLGQRRVVFDTRHHLIHAPGEGPSRGSCGIRLSVFDPAGLLLLARSYQVCSATAS